MPSLAMVFNILATDSASGVFQRVGGSAAAAGREVEASSGKMSRAMSAVGIGVGVAAAAFAVHSIKMASQFDANMTLIQTQAGATSAEVKKMIPAVLSLAGQTAQAPEALATSMYHAYSVTQNMAKSLDVVRAAAKLATVSHSDLEQTTNALTAAVASNIPGVQNMDQAIGALNATVGAGDMKMTDLNEAMSSGLLTVVKGYGLSMRDVGAALATFGDNNIRGANAATMLRMSVQAMAVPVKAGDNILKALGVTTGQTDQALSKYGITSKKLAQDMQTGGLNKAITDLHDRLAAAGVKGNQVGEILTTAFGKKAGPGVAVLLSQFDRLQQKYGAVDKATNTFGAEWAATTKTTQFQMDALGQSVQAMAISFGNYLMPAVTAGLSWMNNTGVPALKSFGSAVADGFHWFSQLPGPVKATAEALAGLALANAIGLFDRLARIGAPVLSMFKSVSGGASAMSMEMRTAFGVAKAAQMDMLAANGLAGGGAQRLMGNLAGIGSAAGAAAKGGLTALKNGFSGLVNMFGGPWVVATAGIVAGFVAQSHAVDDWAKALQQGGDEAAKATDQMKAQAAPVRSLSGLWDGVTGGFKEGISQLKGYSGSLDEATQKAKKMHDALAPMARAQQDVTANTNDLNRAVSTFGVDSEQARFAAWRLGLATGDVATNQAEMDRATRGANGALSNQLSLQEQLSQAGLSADQANLSAIQSIDQYKASLKDANLTESSRRQILNDVAQSMFGVLDAAKRQADAETKGLPVTVTTNQEIVRQRDALNAVVKQLGFVPDSLKAMYDKLNGPTTKALQATKTNVDNVGTAMTTVTNNDIPGLLGALGKLAEAAGVKAPAAITGGFIPTVKGAGDHAVITGTKVFGLGTIINNLPKGHNTVITADTTKANKTVDDFLARVKSQGFVGAIFNVGAPIGNGGNGGNPVGLPPIRRAVGGPITGPGSGTSDSVLVAASNGEHMWTASEVAAAGGHSGVESLRKAVLAAGHGLAGGGPVPSGMSYPVDFSATVKSRMAQQLQAAIASSVGPPGSGVERWRATVDQVLRLLGQPTSYDNGVLAMIQAESGGNPRAINLTDSNAAAGHPSQGLMQTIPSTFAAYAGPYAGLGITNGLANIYAGVNYALHRYGPGILASGGRHSAPGHYIGYEKGTNFVPHDGPAYLHKGEAVVPAALNKAPRFTVYAQFGSETIEATAVRVVDNALGSVHDLVHNATGH